MAGVVVVPWISGSNKTTVSVATGQNDYYPLYGGPANLHNNVRRAHRNGMVLVAFLAIPKCELLVMLPEYRSHQLQVLGKMTTMFSLSAIPAGSSTLRSQQFTTLSSLE